LHSTFVLYSCTSPFVLYVLLLYCRWEDEAVRKRIGHPPSYAEAKKMKSLTLHTMHS